MDVTSFLGDSRMVETAPSLRKRMSRHIAATRRNCTIDELCRFREQLEADMAPQQWTKLEAPMVTLLADVCDALGFNANESARVLGADGVEALDQIVETRYNIRLEASLNERQAKAMAHVRQIGAINLSTYRELCPDLSDETLRRDLANLVRRGLLAKIGAKRGTFYTAAAQDGTG